MPQLEICHLIQPYKRLRIMDPARVDRLVASIAREGQRTPVLVTTSGALIDGYHRIEALKRLHEDLVDAVDLQGEAPEVLVLAWRLERSRRRSALEEAWMISELIDTHGLTAMNIAQQLGRSKSWLSERLGMHRILPDSVQEAIRKRIIPPNAAMKSLVPFARADREACAQLVEALTVPVTVRQISQLYGAWRMADDEGRKRIVEHPMLLLQAEAAVSAVSPDLQELLVRDFEAIAGLCRRARRRTKDGGFPRGNSSAWIQAQEAFSALKAEVDDARL